MIKSGTLYLSYEVLRRINLYTKKLEEQLKEQLEFQGYNSYRYKPKRPDLEKRVHSDRYKISKTKPSACKDTVWYILINGRYQKISYIEKIEKFLRFYRDSKFTSHQQVYGLALLLKEYKGQKTYKGLKRYLKKNKKVYDSPEALDALVEIIILDRSLHKDQKNRKKIKKLLTKKSRKKKKHGKRNRKNNKKC